jgi:hypothetical protein
VRLVEMWSGSGLPITMIFLMKGSSSAAEDPVVSTGDPLGNATTTADPALD